MSTKATDFTHLDSKTSPIVNALVFIKIPIVTPFAVSDSLALGSGNTAGTNMTS